MAAYSNTDQHPSATLGNPYYERLGQSEWASAVR
eukprot:SAG31_NODE_18965_length_616_cov_1.249516_1_plen_34_part_01